MRIAWIVSGFAVASLARELQELVQ